jgi:hypothetical protein
VGTATDMANEVKAALEGKRDRLNANLVYQFNGQKTYEVRDKVDMPSLESFF